MDPFSLRAFQRHQEHDLKHPSLVDLVSMKQNKLSSLIDRLVWPVSLAEVLPRPQTFFLPKPGFLEFIEFFRSRNH
jgi:hypothetical protein